MEFDLYDVGDATTYRPTLRLPVQGQPAVYGGGNIVAVRDTTAHIYRLSPNRQ